ncbi:MAG: Ser-Thr-rich GPI-anchored membrane family protein [Patescibacteria group bacterium]
MKIKQTLLTFFITGVLLLPMFASATTLQETIAALQAQIQTLLAQLAELQEEENNDPVDEEETEEALEDAEDALENAKDEVAMAEGSDEDTDEAEELLAEAEDLLEEAFDAFYNEDWDEVINLTDEVQNLVDEALDSIQDDQDNGPTRSSKIKVLYPNGGEGIVRGAAVPISWFIGTSNSSSPFPVDIWIVKEDDGQKLGLTFGVTPDYDTDRQSYRWVAGTVAGDPRSTALMPDPYRIRVCPENKSTSCDTSDDTFDLLSTTTTPPPVKTASLTVTSPNGGEMFTMGSDMEITWTSKNYPAGTPVKLHLIRRYVSGGITKHETVKTISEGTTNDGEYVWYIPSVPSGGSYLVQVGCVSGAPFDGGCNGDLSNALFTITRTTIQASDSDDSPDYELVAPYPITPQNYPDLFTKGISKGEYVSSDRPWVFGKGDSPPSPPQRSTSETYSTYYDHCATKTQLNEGFVTSNGRLGAAGVLAPDGYECKNGIFVATTASTPFIRVSSPDGGETWYRGESNTISWTSGGFDGDVRVYIDDGAGGSFPLCMIASVSANEKKMVYAPQKSAYCLNLDEYKTLPVGSYKVLLYGYSDDEEDGDFVAKDTSDGYFTLIDTTTPPVSNASPIGYHDTLSCTVAEGWTCDADDYSKALKVKFVDGSVKGGFDVGATTANITREIGVGTACGGVRAHGFRFTIPESIKDGKTHQIYAYGVDPQTNGMTLLSATPRSITCSAPTPPPTSTECIAPKGLSPSGTISVFTEKVTLSWGAVDGAVSYNVRLDDGTSARYDDPRFTTCLGGGSPHYYCEDGITGTSITDVPLKGAQFVDGRAYTFWVDPNFSPGRNYCNGNTKFSIPAQTTSSAAEMDVYKQLASALEALRALIGVSSY